MSEPIPESVPTSVSNRSHRPTKKRALTPLSQQSAQVEALFANPDRADAVIAVGPKPKALQAPPELVTNVQGSSAGAGSGEFHVYKASRRREYERLQAMEDEMKAEKAEQEFQERKEKREREDEERLSKNRNRRQKAKARQQKKKQGTSNAMEAGDDAPAKDIALVEVKKKLGPAKTQRAMGEGAAEGATEDDIHNTANGGNESATNEGNGITIHDDD